VVRTLAMPCRVIEFLDGTEQRWAAGDPLNSFALTFQDVPAAELLILQNWFDTVKGAFDSTWGFTSVDGAAYPHMGLDQDELPAVEGGRPGLFSCSVKMRQVAPDGAYVGVTAATYPALPNGVYTQRPFSQGRKWLTTRNDLASGARLARHEWGAAKRFWSCDYSAITLAELQGRLDFFVAMRGRLRTFGFIDPQLGGAPVPNCRFDGDEFAARCLGAGQWAVSLMVAEFFV
jgi:hypothetical protein